MENNQNKNIKLTLSWNGENFSGYQYQPHAFTVQEALTTAWKILTQEDVTLHGCSRLDAKVHAQSYVMNFYSNTGLDTLKIVRGLNGILHRNMKLDISIFACEFAEPYFHARFHAVGKHYRYLVWHGFSEHALFTKRCWHVRSKNSLHNLEHILKQFEGEHDFAAFRASDCGAKTTVRRMHNIYVTQHPKYEQMHIVDVFGEGFLKNMIRNMVGTAVQIATEKLDKNTITDAFLHKDRTQIGTCAPAHALTLIDVYYDKEKFDSAKTNQRNCAVSLGI